MDKITSLLIFDVWGKMAHFRKYYTNSSSLSYSFPPPTTLVGMIAGILGYERDSYYEKFSMDKVKIAVKINNRVRKTMQTVNHVRTKSFSEFNGSGGHTQVPFELILPTDNRISYRIYFAHKDKEIVKNLKRRVEEKKYIYPPYMGASEFIAITEFVDFIKDDSIEFNKTDDYVNISTTANMMNLEERGLLLTNHDGYAYKYYKEKMVREFNKNRKPREISYYITEQNGKNIYAKLNSGHYEVKYRESIETKIVDRVENIVFL